MYNYDMKKVVCIIQVSKCPSIRILGLTLDIGSDTEINTMVIFCRALQLSLATVVDFCIGFVNIRPAVLALVIFVARSLFL